MTKIPPELAAKWEEEAGMRRIAFFGVLAATTTAFLLVITVPMAYNYAQQVHSVLQSEIDFCKVPTPATQTRWECRSAKGSGQYSI